MVKKYAYICMLTCVIVFVNGLSLRAQPVNDSMRTNTLPSFELNDVKEYQYTAGVNVKDLPMDQLTSNASINALGDVIMQNTSAYLRNYGNGMLSGLTLRGFGPERSNIVWNGISINNPGLGQADLNLLPGGFFSSIQLIEGSSSTQYGNAAQGGSLLLTNTPNYDRVFDVRLHQEFGSFFTWNTCVQTSYGNKNFQGKTSFIRHSSDNDYAYKDKTTAGFPVRLTTNASFTSYQVMQDLFFRWKKNWQLSVHGWYNNAERYIPPAMGAVNNHQRQWDESIRVTAAIRKTFRKHMVNFQVAYVRDKIIFHADGVADSALIHNGQLQGQYVWNASKHFNLMAGGNFTLYYSDYTSYVNHVTDLRGNVFVLANIYLDKPVKFSAGIRQQFSTNYTSLPSAHAGMDHTLVKEEHHQLLYKIGLSSAYRMPTLNDLYWVPGGDPDLKAEYSWNVENTWNYTYRNAGWKMEVLATVFYGRTDNWIQWIPTPMGYWTPQNINRVESAGASLQAGFEFNRKKWKVSAKANYAFTHAYNLQGTTINTQLIYVPEHTINGTIEIKWDRLYARFLPQFYSKRYTLADNSQFIPSYFILGIQAGYELKLKSCSLSFFGRVNNATNTDYQTIVNRPMPWVNYSAGIQFYFNMQTIKHDKK